MRKLLLALALAAVAVPGKTADMPECEVSVLYAGSLGNLMEKDLGPAFAKATGCAYRGEGKGSVALARMIKDGLRRADVFISADPKVDEILMGAPNGGKVRWYGLVFRNEMVIGYNPKSRFADRFKAAAAGKLPFYQVLQDEGLRLGRTDPRLDPKGNRTLVLFQRAETRYHRPGLSAKILGAPENPQQVFPEEQLEVRLETGQLDAGVFYRNEVEERGLPFIALPKEVNLGDSIVYTITVLEDAPHRRAAIAFVNFFLSEPGRRILKKHGLAPVKWTFTGELPAGVRAAP